MATYNASRQAWRITATASRPGEARRRRVRDFHAPNTRAGRRAAEAAEVRFRDEIAAELAADTYAGTFAEAAADWVKRNREDWSPLNVRHVERALRAHVIPTLGPIALEEVTAEDIANLYADWAEAGYAKPTRRRWHGMVRAIFSEAIRLGRLTVDPMVRVKPAGRTRADTPPTIPEPDDIEAAIAAAPTVKAGRFFKAAARTGARRDSVLNLRWRDVDLDEATLHFTVTKEDEPYTVAIDAELVAELRTMRREALETAMALGLGRRIGDLYLFSSDGGLTPWGVSWPSHAWRKAADAVGLYEVRLHDLRHFHASRLLKARFSHAEVAERLGCTEANVIRTYSHVVDRDADRRAAGVIGDLFAAG